MFVGIICKSDENSEDRAKYDAMRLRKSFKRNPRARVEYQKKAFGDEIIDTELELVVFQNILKPGYDFLRVFQSKEVKIHLLYIAYKELLADILLEICEPQGLCNSKGSELAGKELKLLVLETKAERRERKTRDSNNYNGCYTCR